MDPDVLVGMFETNPANHPGGDAGFHLEPNQQTARCRAFAIECSFVSASLQQTSPCALVAFMQLSLIRRGGFAGLRPPAFVVDLTALPPATAQEFERLIAAAKNDLPHLARPGAGQPDRFTYVLTVAGQPGASEQFEFDELAATPPIMALVGAIQKTARNQAGPT